MIYLSSIKNVKLVLLTILSLFCMLMHSCKKETATKLSPVYNYTIDSIVDIDSNVYTIVKIGNQWWMAEDLKTKTYRNGKPIKKIGADTAIWRKDTVGAFCIFEESTTAPGLLYNWYAVSNDSNVIAPEGWHIPSDTEWKELEVFLGMNESAANNTGWRGSNEGEKLKVKAPLGWSPYGEVWATNESGFAALAGGCRLFNGIFGTPGLFCTGFWWSSTVNENKVWYRYLDYKNKGVFRSSSTKNYGYSVRCVKNQ